MSISLTFDSILINMLDQIVFVLMSPELKGRSNTHLLHMLSLCLPVHLVTQLGHIGYE